MPGARVDQDRVGGLQVLEEPAHGLHAGGNGHRRVVLGEQPKLVVLDRLAAHVAHVGDALAGQVTKEHGQRTVPAFDGGRGSVADF